MKVILKEYVYKHGVAGDVVPDLAGRERVVCLRLPV